MLIPLIVSSKNQTSVVRSGARRVKQLIPLSLTDTPVMVVKTGHNDLYRYYRFTDANEHITAGDLLRTFDRCGDVMLANNKRFVVRCSKNGDIWGQQPVILANDAHLEIGEAYQIVELGMSIGVPQALPTSR